MRNKKLSRKKMKKNKVRYLNPGLFKSYPWATYKSDVSGGKVFCGICYQAKLLKCDQWIHGKTTKQDAWVNGIGDWGNLSREAKWSSHQGSKTHTNSIAFLLKVDRENVERDIDNQHKSHISKSQILNRYFLGSVIKSVIFLGKRCLPFYGDRFRTGLLHDLLTHIGKEYIPTLSKNLESTKQDKSYLKVPYHFDDIQFMLNECHHQIGTHEFKKLIRSKAIAIIADEWSDIGSQEYCSISARYVMDNLEEGVVFLGFTKLDNIRAVTIAEAIKKAFNKYNALGDVSKKIVAQTYDGAANMQGHLNGVQHILRQDYAPFGAPLHCMNHQLQLSVKMRNKESDLMKRITDNCLIIVKIVRYSPKRATMLDSLKRNEIAVDSNYYSTLKSKILDFSITRWTVRHRALNNIRKNYIPLLTLFAKILSDNEEKKGLNTEKKAEINGLFHYMQKFEFFFGLKLSEDLYTIIDKTATKLQYADVNITVAMHLVTKLITDLDNKKMILNSFGMK